MSQIKLSDGSGSLIRWSEFPSASTASRTVDIWLPPGYESSRKPYPVLYCHDGQNLFDPALAYGGVDWGVHRTLERLARAENLPLPIVVGIWNSPTRWPDYMPASPLASPAAASLLAEFTRQQGSAPLSDDYLRFLVHELKPKIDSAFRTLPDQPHTFLMGSSMGGLISLYALEEYPQVFGGAACLSTHWPAGGNLLVDALGAALPPPGSHRLYFDFGTAALDWNYEPFQLRMDEHLRRRGCTPGVDWLTLKFEGAEHNEAAWASRLHHPLRFLLGKLAPG
jgi:predicted alpha/beta superfamily hydrolase